MESLKKKFVHTSFVILNGDMGGWVSRVLQLGRLRRRPGVGLVDEALQLLVLGVVHR
jgi:hypothetical protein